MSNGTVEIDTKLNNDNFKNGINKLGNIAKTGLKGVTVAVGTVTTALAGLSVASVNSYADLEQNVGGIETLFKDSADKVIKNAENAYKTAGMSANEYMATVTSFSASLLQSLGGDTEKAAESADMAITDMADNANKMGTSMEAIQNAYQGFAKQNYTMLDNLKLGYGGTKTEMERLLADAEKISGIKYDISNLNDVYQAIHVIQGELGITGTTAKEASETITGSINSMKSAFSNFINGSGTIDQVIETTITATKNIFNAVEQLIPNIIQSIANATPQIVEAINQIFPQILNLLVTQLPILLQNLGTIFSTIIQSITEYLPQILELLVNTLTDVVKIIIENLPAILEAVIQGVVAVMNSLSEQLPTLIPLIVQCILDMVDVILDNLDLFIDASIQLILALAEGLIEALPDLIEKIPEIIDKLIQAIIDNLPKIIEMGITLIIKLVEGIIKAIPSLIKAIPQIIMSLINGFKNYFSNFHDVGRNIVEGLWNGIKNAGSWITNKVKSFAKGILDGMKNALGIHSPSKLFKDEVGKYIALGVGEGFTDNIDSVYKKMKSTVDFETQKLNANLTSNSTLQVERNLNLQARLESIDNNKEIVINSVTNLDSKVIAKETNKVNSKQKLQYGLE